MVTSVQLLIASDFVALELAEGMHSELIHYISEFRKGKVITLPTPLSENSLSVSSSFESIS